MNTELQSFLNQYGFQEEKNLEALKGTLIVANKDLRYYWDGKAFGLHVSNMHDFEDTIWKQLETIEGIKECLTVLYITNNIIYSFELEDFVGLKFLKISENVHLKALKFKNLNTLIELNTSFCPALESMELLGNFEKLEKLDVSASALKTFILPKKLPNLRYFNFRNNQLENDDFLEFINKSERIECVFGNNNSFNDDVLKGILEDNRNYEEVIEKIKELFKRTKTLVNRNKLILLGNTQAGKTSLCDILRGENTANGDSTHGVNIFGYNDLRDADGEKFSYQIYDFGGQDFYHNTHLAFFGANAKYILIWGNGQEDKFGSIKAKKHERNDEIFPKSYWLESVFTNLNQNNTELNSKADILDKNKIKLSVCQNIKANNNQLLNQKELVEKYGINHFFDFQLRNRDGKRLPKNERKEIKGKIDKWLIDNSMPFKQLETNILWADFFAQNPQHVVLPKTVFKKDITIDFDSNSKKGLSNIDFDFLHYAFVVYACTNEKQGCLNKYVITNIGVFTQWIYAILNLNNLFGKGYFNKKDAEKWLKVQKFKDAIVHLDFIIDFLLEYKMIFSIEGSNDYLVPQYLPKPQLPADILLLKLFDKPFVKYEFTGFYHTQILTDIIAGFFSMIVKEPVERSYKYLIWKNKVILYLDDKEAANSNDFLLIDFDIIDQVPTLALSEITPNALKSSYHNLHQVIDFIERKIEKFNYRKSIKTPNANYIDAKLLKDENRDSQGHRSDLIYDSETKFFYRKGDFPLFFDPKYNPMKKIFISYSKSDEKYKNEFKKHFYPLKRQSKIDTFDDSDLGFGEWNPQILKKIEECDIFVCLVSIDFLNTDYIINTELPHAIKFGKLIIPIKIRECDWSDFILEETNEEGGKELKIKLGDYNASLKAKTISLFDNKDDKNDKNDYVDKRGNTPEERDAVWTQLVQQFKKRLSL